MEFLEAITSAWDVLPAWLNAALGVFAAAKAVTILTPTPSDDRWLGRLYRLIECAALVVGRAKNAPADANRS